MNLSKHRVGFGLLAVLILSISIYLLNRDHPSVAQKFDKVIVVGPVSKVVYTRDGGNTPGRAHETDVYSMNGTADFCDDVSEKFAVGQSYRVNAVRIDHDQHTSSGTLLSTCLRLKNIEQLRPSPQTAELYGKVIAVKSKDDDDYAFDVTAIDEDQSTKVRLCNAQFPDGGDLFTALTEAAAINSANPKKSLIQTVFYNSGDKSKRFDCYPILAIRNENRNVAFGTDDATPYFGVSPAAFASQLPPHFKGD